MRTLLATLRLLVLLAAACALSACGAGLIGGVLASDDGSGGQASAPPSLSLPTQAFPLSPGPLVTTRSVVVANAALSTNAALVVRVRVRGPGLPDGQPTYVAAADQLSPTLVSGQGASTVVGFQLRMDPIVAVVGASSDVAAELVVIADGREVAPPVAVTLLAQPTARLFDGAPIYLSPSGGQVVRFACRNLRSLDSSGLAVFATTVDATGASSSVTRPCARPSFKQAGDGDPPLLPGERLVTAEAPNNSFAGPVTFVVEDVVSGRSGPVDDAYYQPDVQIALPAQGSTRGGTKVTLVGRALLPLLTGSAPGAPDFDALQVQLRKGDRVLDVASAAIVRSESALDRVVLIMPPSPDGRPGDVGIALRVRVPGPSPDPIAIEVVARDVYRYANPEPVFGPRGALLDRDPIAVAPIALEGAPNSAQATDFAALYATGGVATVQLLLAQENGLFIRFGAARRIGDPEAVDERSPRDMVSGDFNRDGVPDLLVVNEGVTSGSMLLLPGQPAPLPPLGAKQRFPIVRGMAKARVADFDGDGGPDVLLLPGANAVAGATPQLLRSQVVGGSVSFLPPTALPVRGRAYDACEIADLDGDGRLDFAGITGRTQMQIDLAYGNGAGGFGSSQPIDLILPRPGYVLDAASPAVGLHAMGATPSSLAVVLAGLPPLPFSTPPGPVENPDTPPLLFVIRPAGTRGYAQPSAVDVVNLVGAIDPFRASCALNLDGDGTGIDELLVGTTGQFGQFSVGLFRFEPRAGLQAVRVSTDFVPTQVSAFFSGVAFPADPALGQPAQAGLFVQHEQVVDGEVERRLSTLLVARDATDVVLLPPDLVFPVPLSNVVGGRFSTTATAAPDGSVRDIAVPSPTRIQLGDNNGFGALAPGNIMTHLGLVPESVARVPEPTAVGDLLAFFDDGRRDGRTDGAIRVGLWKPEGNGPQQQSPQMFSEDLRPWLPTSLQALALDPSSRLLAADVDGDGDQDLTALLRFVGASGSEDAVLLLLRRVSALAGAYPFLPVEPQDVVRVPGSSPAFVLGDFASGGQSAPVRLELALVAPSESSPGAGDGNHVRFYRLHGTGASLRWARSQDAAGPAALTTGNQPARLVAGDFDGNGTADLMVACDGDASLRVHLNTGEPASQPDEVAIGAFVESFGSPLSTPAGRHTYLLLGDINGDGDGDALIATDSTTPQGELSTQVTFHLRVGAGEFGNGIRVSPTRLSNRDARLAIDLGDINRDGAPDLTLGWAQSGTQTDNLLVLLGGSL